MGSSRLQGSPRARIELGAGDDDRVMNWHKVSVHSNPHYHVSCCCIDLLACVQQNGICTPSYDR
jgi:hypothetical protein